MENITENELLEEIRQYIGGQYDYEQLDFFGDELQYTLENGTMVNITINIDISKEGE